MISNSVKQSIDDLSKKWKIDQEVYDLHIGRRKDVADTVISINSVIFHIPTLSDDGLFILWKCLWPDCHNCCERQGRLPLTKDDLDTISKRLGYSLKSEFTKNETRISSWKEQESFGNIITTLSMLSLKRKSDERDDQDGEPLRCRFLDSEGSCEIHPDKPGVCWLYPFTSWLESDNGKPVVHATFQLTGDCPGFYVSRSIDDMTPILQEYSKRIYDYNMAVTRTTRENYGFINIVDLSKPPQDS